MSARRLGLWSAAAVFGIGVAYALVLGAGIAIHGLREPITDPVLAVMELLTILSSLPIVTLMAAVHERAAPGGRVYGVTALAFATAFAGATSAVHFTELTAVRQLGGGGIAWPSRAYAVELLAWDVFLGLALVFAALAFEDFGNDRAARRGLLVCGALCLAGTVGPVVGNMRLQLAGVLGYAVVLPVVAFRLARLFAGERAGTSASAYWK
jgi:hypothetical protein